QVPREGALQQRGPVLVKVLPQPELGELQDGQVGGLLDVERQSLLRQGTTDSRQRRLEVDTGQVFLGLSQVRDVQAVRLLQLLQQTIVGGAPPGLVKTEPV